MYEIWLPIRDSIQEAQQADHVGGWVNPLRNTAGNHLQSAEPEAGPEQTARGDP